MAENMLKVGKYEVDLSGRMAAGRFGEVYKGTHSTTGQVVVMKKYFKARYAESVPQNITLILPLLGEHPNLMKQLEVDCNPDSVWTMLEFCEGGDLQTYINCTQLEFREKLLLMYQCARGLAYIHSQDVVHRHVKPGHILIETVGGHTSVAKVAMCYLSHESSTCVFPEDDAKFMNGFVAPEIFKEQQYSQSVDVVSLGLIFLALLSRKRSGRFLKNLLDRKSPAVTEMAQCLKSNQPMSLLVVMEENDKETEAVKSLKHLVKRMALEEQRIEMFVAVEELKKLCDKDDIQRLHNVLGIAEKVPPKSPKAPRHEPTAEQPVLKQVNHIKLADLSLDRNQILGSGSSGYVYLSDLHGTAVAVKELMLSRKTGRSIRAVKNEVLLSASVHHPNIVLFMGYALDLTLPSRAFLLVYECVDGQNLFDIISSGELIREYSLDRTKRYHVLLQIAQALAYLHLNEKKIIHGDVKPANMLLSRQGVAKLCDLGLSKIKDTTEVSVVTTDGGLRATPIYMAPEQLLDRKSSSTRSDVYSFGASAFHLLFEAYMWQLQEDEDEGKTKSRLDLLKDQMEREKNPETLNTHRNDPAHWLIAKCVQFEHSKRPQARWVLDELKRLYQSMQVMGAGNGTDSLQQ